MKWMLKFMALALLLGSDGAVAEDLCVDDFKPSSAVHSPRDDVAHNPSPFSTLPDPVWIPLTIDMARRYGLDVPDGTVMEGNLGMIEIYKNGRIVYNGEDISQDIKDKCDYDAGEFEAIIERESQNGNYSDSGRKLP